MPFKVVPLREEHAEDAAALVAAAYRAQRERVPSLPARYEDVEALLPPLRDLAGQAPGVAAVGGGAVRRLCFGYNLIVAAHKV